MMLKAVLKVGFLRGGPTQGQQRPVLGAGNHVLLWAAYITSTFSDQHK